MGRGKGKKKKQRQMLGPQQCALCGRQLCPTDVRNIMFEKYLDTESDIRTHESPQLLQELELAIWWLLGVQGRQKTATSFLDILGAL